MWLTILFGMLLCSMWHCCYVNLMSSYGIIFLVIDVWYFLYVLCRFWSVMNCNQITLLFSNWFLCFPRLRFKKLFRFCFFICLRWCTLLFIIQWKVLFSMVQSHTSHILGFKFQYYQRPEVKDNVPDGLYILAATLIKANFIDLESV